MRVIRAIVVDDSPFSRTIIAQALIEAGCEVVGEADSLDALIETYNKCKPDIVTMDITMPGADGFECSKVLRRHDPEAKIIMISSMKDEETEAEACRIGIVGYVQKPVDIEGLKQVIVNVLAPEFSSEKLKACGLDTFKEALAQNITRMTKTTVSFTGERQLDTYYVSQGITVVIGIIGQQSGSMIIDLSTDSAEKIAEIILRRGVKNREEVLTMVAELANIIAGVACSMLNKMNKALGFRVSPPSLFYGAPTEIVTPGVEVQGVYAETAFGRIFLGIGFKKGAALWM